MTAELYPHRRWAFPPQVELLETRIAPTVSDFRQGSNQNPTLGDVVWINGILNSGNSEYFEGMSVLQRLIFDEIPATAGNVHTLTFSHDAGRGGTTHAYDFLTSWPQGVAAANAIVPGQGLLTNINECGPNITASLLQLCIDLHTTGFTATPSVPDNMDGVEATFDAINPRIAAYELVFGNRTIKLYSTTAITAASLTFNEYSGTANNPVAEYTLTWTAAPKAGNVNDLIVEFATHLAVGTDPLSAGIGYGAGKGAGAISGGPYHVQLSQLDGASLGSQDNQIQAGAAQAPAIVKVIKDAQPNDAQDFTFSRTGGPNFLLDDDADGTLPNMMSFGYVSGQSINIQELLPVAGWDLSNIAIVESVSTTGQATNFATGLATVFLDPGETVTITYTNQKRGSITVVKDAVPNSAQDFTFTRSFGGNFALDDDADGTLPNTTTFTNLTPGSYTITELATLGWDLTSIQFSGDDGDSTGNTGTGAASLVLDPGENITVTFTNTKKATVKVVKNAVGGNDTFTYTTGGQLVGQGSPAVPNPISVTTTGGMGMSSVYTFSNLPAAGQSLTLDEILPAGWDFTNVVVSGDAQSTTTGDQVTLDVDPGEDIVVTYTNTKQATVKVVKVAVGGNDTFDFDGTGALPTDFDLTTVAGMAMQTFTFNNVPSAGLAATANELAANLPAGWNFTSLTVVGDDDSSIAGALATLNIEPGETITVTYTNTKQATVKVVKVAIGGNDTFDFDGTGALPVDFDLTTVAGMAMQTFTFNNAPAAGLAATANELAANLPTGWNFTSLTVVGDDDSSIAGALATLNIEPGETIVVTYTNTKQATVKVVKVAVGGNDTFDFDGTGALPTDFDITTVAGMGMQTFTFSNAPSAGLAATANELAANLPAGWNFTSLTVVGDDDSSVAGALATLNIEPGETITVTYTNTKQATVKVVKVAIGGNDTFDFDGTGALPVDFDLTTVAGMAMQTFTFSNAPSAGLAATVNELAANQPAGWDFTSLTVVGDDDSSVAGALATLNIEPGETITLTYTNTKQATVKVVKVAVGGNDTFDFDGTGVLPVDFDITTVAGMGMQTFTFNNVPSAGVAATANELAANLPAGWNFTSLTVVGDDDSSIAGALATLNIEPGETITVTYTNTKQATVKVVKVAVGGNDAFDFDGTGALPTDFDITTVAGMGMQTFTFSNAPSTGLAATANELAANLPTGWNFTSLSVVGDDDSSVAGALATLNIEPGENITVTYTNTKQATVKVVKVAVGGNDAFDFDGTGALPVDFDITTVAGMAMQTFTFNNAPSAGLAATANELAANLPTGWNFTSLTVVGDDDSSVAGAVATLNIEPGENITVTYTNTKQATVKVVKVAVGGNDAFDFDGTGALPVDFDITTVAGMGMQTFTFSNAPSAGLAATANELAANLPAGWDFTSLTVVGDDDSSIAGALATLNIEPGETITVTYTNTKQATVKVVKVAIGGNDTFDFDGTGALPVDFDITTVAGMGMQTFTFSNAPSAGLAATANELAANLPAGWNFTSLIVVGDDDSSVAGALATLNIEPGETITLTYTNTKQATVKVVKVAVGGNDTFDFDGTGALPVDFDLTTVAGMAMQTFTFSNAPSAGLAATANELAANLPAGWNFTSLTVVGDDDSSVAGALATLNIEPGETITVTYTNTKQATVKVVKVAIGGNDTFDFDGTGALPVDFDLTTVAGMGMQTFTFSNAPSAGLAATANELAANLPAGWDFTSLTVVGDDDSSIAGALATLNIEPGETITVTYTNTKQATVKVVKVAIGGNDTFDFDGTGALPVDFDITTVAGMGMQTFTFSNAPSAGLAATANELAANLPTGWNFTSLTVVGDDDSSVAGAVATLNIEPGENITVTYTNTKQATVKVVKVAVGGNDAFDFDGTGALPVDFDITTVAGMGMQTFTFSNAPSAGLAATANELAANLPAGWNFTSLTVVGDDDSSVVGAVATLNIEPGETITVTYTNTRQTTVKVIKLALGGDDTFDFDGTGALPTDFDIVTTAGMGMQVFTFTSVPSGGLAATVNELAANLPAGWDFTSLTVVGDDDSSVAGALATLNIEPGETITVTYTNTKQATVKVVKVAIGGNDTFDFDGTGALPTDFDLTTVAGMAMQTFTFSNAPTAGLAAMANELAGNLPAGWNFTSLTVVGDDDSSVAGALATLNIEPGETITLTYTNTKQATVKVVKVAVGGNDTFDFDGTGALPVDFDLTTVAGMAMQTFTFSNAPSAGLAATANELAANLPAGWNFTSLTVVGDDDSSIAGALATLNIEPGENITVTYTNTKQATVKVVKVAIGGNDTFDFDGTGALPVDFDITTVAGMGMQTFTISNAPAAGVAATANELAANLPAGWDFTSLTVVGDDDSSVAGALATLNIEPGETITVTYTNTKQATVKVVKVAVGGNDTFDFDGTGALPVDFDLTTVAGMAMQTFTFNNAPSAGLAATANELAANLPAGWNFTSLTVVGDDDSSIAGALATLNIEPGENITVTYTNTKQATVKVVKVAVGGNDTFDFDGTGALPVDFDLTTVAGMAMQTFTFNNAPAAGLAATANELAANLPAGWNFTSLTVVGDDDSSVAGALATLNIEPGETITVTYTNTKQATVKVVKVAVGGNDTFDFDGTGALPVDFDITTVAGMGMQTFTFSNAPSAGLAATANELAANLPAGWNFTSLSVVGDDDSSVAGALATLNIEPGETITVTYTNTKQATVKVVKNAVGGNATFDFDGTGALPVDFDITTVAGMGMQTFTFSNVSSTGLAATANELAANLPAGWTFTSLTVAGDDDSSVAGALATLNIEPGETIVVTYTNTLSESRIIVEKQTNPDGSVQPFEFDTSYGPNFFLADGQTNDSGILAPGSYTVQELATAGWNLTGLQIVSGDLDNGSSTNLGTGTATIDLDPGETITVRFTNTQRGRIIVIKDVIPTTHAQDFTYTTTGAGLPASFQLDDDADGTLPNTLTFVDLLPGNYTITEGAVATWQVAGFNIVDPSGGSSGDTNLRKASLNLAPGETITVTFYNCIEDRFVIFDPDGPGPLTSVTVATFDPAPGSMLMVNALPQGQNSGVNTSAGIDFRAVSQARMSALRGTSNNTLSIPGLNSSFTYLSLMNSFLNGSSTNGGTSVQFGRVNFTMPNGTGLANFFELRYHNLSVPLVEVSGAGYNTASDPVILSGYISSVNSGSHLTTNTNSGNPSASRLDQSSTGPADVHSVSLSGSLNVTITVTYSNPAFFPDTTRRLTHLTYSTQLRAPFTAVTPNQGQFFTGHTRNVGSKNAWTGPDYELQTDAAFSVTSICVPPNGGGMGFMRGGAAGSSGGGTSGSGRSAFFFGGGGASSTGDSSEQESDGGTLPSSPLPARSSDVRPGDSFTPSGKDRAGLLSGARPARRRVGPTFLITDDLVGELLRDAAEAWTASASLKR